MRRFSDCESRRLATRLKTVRPAIVPPDWYVEFSPTFLGRYSVLRLVVPQWTLVTLADGRGAQPASCHTLSGRGWNFSQERHQRHLTSDPRQMIPVDAAPGRRGGRSHFFLSSPTAADERDQKLPGAEGGGRVRR